MYFVGLCGKKYFRIVVDYVYPTTYNNTSIHKLCHHCNCMFLD